MEDRYPTLDQFLARRQEETDSNLVLHTDSIVGSVFQFLENVAGEVISDLAVAGNRLTGAGSRILIPIVPAAVTDQDTSCCSSWRMSSRRFMISGVQPHDGRRESCLP